MSQSALLPHITNYRLVLAAGSDELRSKVEAEIHNGWQPFGSFGIDRANDETAYVQPMVRYAEWHT